jgi:hypothetical protein
MFAMVFTKQNVYTTGCGILAALMHFSLLVYFFWLFITVVMHFIALNFWLQSFKTAFRMLATFSIGNSLKSFYYYSFNIFKFLKIVLIVFPALVSTILFIIHSTHKAQIYQVRNKM